MSNKIEVCNENVKGDQKPMAKDHPEAYMYWIHCNKCYYLFFKKTSAMLLLSCHHVLCENCLVKHTADFHNITYKCAVCSKIVHARMINNNLADHLKELFHPTPWLSDLPIPRIINFQQKHREHLFEALKNYEHRCIRKKNFVLEKYESVKKQGDALRRLWHENKELERHVRKILPAFKHHRRSKKAQQKQAAKNSISESIQIVETATKHSVPRGSPANAIGSARTRQLILNGSYNGTKNHPLSNSKVMSFSSSRPQGFFQF